MVYLDTISVSTQNWPDGLDFKKYVLKVLEIYFDHSSDYGFKF